MSELRSLPEVVADRTDDLERRLRRFLTGGNAGGLIASLTLMGTMLRAEEAAPRALFIVILLYLLGLASVGAAFIGEAIGIRRQLEIVAHQSKARHEDGDWAKEDVAELHRLYARAAAARRWVWYFIVPSAIFLAAGTVLGIMQLWRLTG